MRAAIAVLSWVAAVSMVEASVGPQIAQAARELEDRLELRLRPAAPSDPPPPPERSGDGSLEPWELVGV